MNNRSFLKENLEALEQLNLPLCRWLKTQVVDMNNIETGLIWNSHGLIDWPLPSGKGLFETINPNQFYRNWVVEGDADRSASIIIGCNLGYGINHLLSNTPNKHKVLVMEPNPEILMACLSQTDYRRFFQIHKLFFLPPDTDVIRETLFRQLELYYEFGKIDMRKDLPSQQIGPEYAQWGQKCNEVLKDFKIEMDTIHVHQDKMVGNELNNFARAMHDGSLLNLKNQGKGLTAVLLGAGPSLEQFVPSLSENQGYALYASAFQTLPALQKFGFKPNFCLGIDPLPVMKSVYNRMDLEWANDIPLIYSCKMMPEALEKYPGPTIPIWTVGGMGANIFQGRELVLNAGRNVGVALTRFLKWCGVSRIVLVGQDFAWSGDKTHATGHIQDKGGFNFDPKVHVELKNKNGETIYSHYTYITALRTLEKELEGIDIPVLNLYGGNAVIEGAPEVTWGEVLSDGILESAPGSLDHFLWKLNQARSPRPWPQFKARSTTWAVSLNSVKKRLEKLFKKANNNQREIFSTLNKLLVFLTQDPLYKPYLLNDIRNLAGLLFVTRKFGQKELAKCKQILKQVLKKAREIDQKLVVVPEKQQLIGEQKGLSMQKAGPRSTDPPNSNPLPT